MAKPTDHQQVIRDSLWRRGIIVPWLGHAVQKRMAADLAASTSKKYVINSARRLGKSFLLCMLAQEHARQNPGSQIKYAAETQRSVKKIILPLMRQIMETCPRELRPKFSVHDLVYSFSNGSEIHIAGSALDQADSLRGTACDLAIIDEAGFIEELEYLIDSVLYPQTLGRPGSRIVMASTPPVSPDHAFVSRYMAQAMAEGSYSRYTIFDNPLLSPEEVAEFMRECGGEDSTTWRREGLAEIVVETDNALFPEVASGSTIDDAIAEIARPSHFVPITAIDLGYTDYTGVLFGYYHFALARIVIEGELLFNKTTSSEIVAAVLAKEAELWGKIPVRTRIVDGPQLAIADMNQTHKFTCRAPEKYDLAANVNRVRMDLAERRIVFNPRCKQAIAQTKFATWNKQKNAFSRGANGGHWDLAAALIYLCKHIDRSTNPIPSGWGWNPFSDFNIPRDSGSQLANSLKAMFPTLAPRKN